MEIIIKCSDDCRGRKDIFGYIYINHVQEIVRCKDCGKLKFVEDIKPWEILEW